MKCQWQVLGAEVDMAISRVIGAWSDQVFGAISEATVHVKRGAILQVNWCRRTCSFSSSISGVDTGFWVGKEAAPGGFITNPKPGGGSVGRIGSDCKIEARKCGLDRSRSILAWVRDSGDGGEVHFCHGVHWDTGEQENLPLWL